MIRFCEIRESLFTKYLTTFGNTMTIFYANNWTNFHDKLQISKIILSNCLQL